jgi:probable HAF family extracellular repeat protein
MNHNKMQEAIMKLRFPGAVLYCAISTMANSALVEMDWKTPGDKSITYDTATGLQWLDLTASFNRSVSDVASQLGVGGDYQGFQYATESEVRTLFSNADIPDLSGEWSPLNYQPVLDLQPLVGITRASFGESFGATGDQGTSPLDILGIGLQQQSNPASSVFEQARVSTNDSISIYQTAFLGHWLIKSVPNHSAVSFMPLGSLGRDPDYNLSSSASGVSADGSVVVGSSTSASGKEAFRWTSEDGMVGLGFLSPVGDDYYSNASGVSADGMVVVGETRHSYFEDEAFRWTSDGGIVGLGYLGPDYEDIFSSSAADVSGDGLIVVGSSSSPAAKQEAFRWTNDGGMVGLGDLPGGDFSSRATGVSTDGSVVVGWSSSSTSIQEAFRWTSDGGMVGLGFLGPDDYASSASGVSADGLVIVGSSTSASGKEAFRWTSEDGMVGLGYLPGGDFSSFASDVSGDGSVVVGSSISAGYEAFRWTSEGGMQSVALLLTTAGVDLTGWELSYALDVSADGYTIVGTGTNPDGDTEAWIAVFSDAPIPTTPVDISGTIKATNDADICAMVLASGQYIFSCNPMGMFSLTDLPRESNGTVKRQIYADGFSPKIDILHDSVDEAVIMTRSGTCPSYNIPYDPAVVPGSAGKWINIAGKVVLQDSQTPICAMALANGHYMFTCDGTGKYALNIPLDTNGQFKLQVYADGFAPTIQKFDEYKTTNDVRMARAVECQ